jgi:flagellar basal-body rod modification protein FlgD
MNVSTVSSNSQSSSAEIASRIPTQTLGQNDFLKLLVTQMTSQDPLNPTKDTDFIAQMAQFSSLEQTKTLTRDMASMSADQKFSQVTGLIGRTVTLQQDKTLVQGTVSGVLMDAGTPKLVVNGVAYDMSQVVSVTPAAVATVQ